MFHFSFPRYNPHINTSAGDADLLRRYLYSDDRMHNRLSESVALNGGAPTVRSFSYNAANQISNAGYTYDDNGNLTHDGVTSMTWDRANRLRAVGTTTPQHFYDGDGRRIRQTVGGTTTQYLYDVSQQLASVLAETTGASVTRTVPGPQGLHGQEDASGAWEYPLADGLGSVRGMADANGAILESRHYDPYGQVFGAVGSAQTEYGYTGERTDAHGLLDLRARRYHPALGAFLSRDPLPVFNRYGYVDGNPVMRTDPSGLLALRTSDGDGGPMPKVVQKQKAGPTPPAPTRVASNPLNHAAAGLAKGGAVAPAQPPTNPGGSASVKAGGKAADTSGGTSFRNVQNGTLSQRTIMSYSTPPKTRMIDIHLFYTSGGSALDAVKNAFNRICNHLCEILVGEDSDLNQVEVTQLKKGR